MFENMTVNELKVVCKILHIDLKTTTKKADIISLINDSGFTYEDYEKATQTEFGYEEAESAKVEPVEVKNETKAESVILKMVYPRSALNISNKAYFTMEEPFMVFTKEKAEEILRLGKDEVRVATPEEVKSFYKV
jgi:hypothetical protein